MRATALIVLLCTLAPLGAGMPSALEYHRSHAEGGEWWRLWTGSFVHFGGAHLFWNVVTLAVLGSVLERRMPLVVRLHYGVCPLLIGLQLWFGRESPDVYRGLSGVVAGLVALGAWFAFRERRRALGLALAAILTAKLLCEFTGSVGISTVTYDRPDVITWPLAHLIGAVCGIGLAAIGSGTPMNTD